MARRPSATSSSGVRAPGGRAPVAGPVGATQAGGRRGQAVAEGPDTRRITQWGATYGLLPVWGWTVEALAAALQGHNVGDFSLSGRLAEDMAAHPFIRDALAVRGQVFTKCPLVITPAGERGEPVTDPDQAKRARGRRCADAWREVMHDVLPLPTLLDLQRIEILMGQGIFAEDYEEVRDGRDRCWVPLVKPWEASLTAYQQMRDERSVDMGAYVATTASHGLVRVDHGRGRWGVFARRTLRPWHGGVVRVLGESYVGDGYNFRDNQTHQDRWGRGIVKLSSPVSWSQEEVNRCASSLIEGGGGGVLQCPTDHDGKRLVDAELLRADGAGWQTFDATEKRILRRIIIAILHQDMLTTGTTGIAENDPRTLQMWECRVEDATCYGDARVEVDWEDAGGDRLPVAVWTPCDGVIRQAITSWWAYWNFGDASLAPYTWWDATPQPDHEARKDAISKRGQLVGAAVQALATGVEKLVGLGAEVDLDYLGEQAGVRLRRDPVTDYDGPPPQPLHPAAPKPGQAGVPTGGPNADVSVGAQGGAPAPAAKRRDGGAVFTDSDISQVQVRISPAGAPFHPGHQPGVGPHGGVSHGGSGSHESHGGGGGSGGGGSGGSGGSAGSSSEVGAKFHADQAKHHAEQSIHHATEAKSSESLAEAKHHLDQAEHHAGMVAHHAAEAHKLSPHDASAQDAQHLHTSTRARISEAHERVEKLTGLAEVPKFFGRSDVDHRALEAAFSAPGHFSAKMAGVPKVSRVGEVDQMSVVLTLHGEGGKFVGQIRRDFNRHESGELRVYHDLFEIGKEYQGKGAAKEVLRNSLKLYEKVGVKEVSVTAGLDKGRYVWASYGFRANQGQTDAYKAKFVSTLRGLGTKAGEKEATIAVKKIKTMQDLADYKVGDQLVGKNFLLKAESMHLPMWHGSIRLDASDPGFQRLRQKLA